MLFLPPTLRGRDPIILANLMPIAACIDWRKQRTGQAMTRPETIAAMAAKGYWTSPGGKTPAATLYSALLREITTKGSGSRFVKTQRGQFARTGVV